MADTTPSTSVAATIGDELPQALLVVNPRSGSGRGERHGSDIAAGMADLGRTAQVVEGGPGSNMRAEVQAFIDGGGRDIVIAGGDGTVRHVVDACMVDGGARADGVVLGIVHTGTGGDFARGLGLPRSLPEAIAVACNGQRHALDVGIASLLDLDGTPVVRPFANVASVGISGDVVKTAEGPLRRLGDTLGFLASTLHGLATFSPHRLRIKLHDGWHTADILDVMVCNGQYVGGGMHVAPLADVGDGRFDLVIAGAAGKLKVIPKLAKLYRGTHLDDPIVRYERVDAVEIDGEDAQAVVLDGDLVGMTPLAIRMAPGALSIRVP